jgi:hypothetical protein
MGNPGQEELQVDHSRTSVVEKLRTAWVKKDPPGSFDCAPSSAMSRDKSVRRSAQDDVFVVSWRETEFFCIL